MTDRKFYHSDTLKLQNPGFDPLCRNAGYESKSRPKPINGFLCITAQLHRNGNNSAENQTNTQYGGIMQNHKNQSWIPTTSLNIFW